MKTTNVKKLTIAGLLIALTVVCSPFSIPVGASRCYPIQHMVNVLSAVLLGPWYGFAMAFVTSLIRVMIGSGTILAFPGSMCGALLCGLVYRWTKNEPLTYIGEVFGTGVLGGMAAYPLAAFILGNGEAALFTYVLPFFVSSAGGTVFAAVLITALKGTHTLERVQSRLAA